MSRSGVLAGFLLLFAGAGCGPAPGEARVAFEGRPSYGLPYADTRRALETCSACPAPLPPGVRACPGCGLRLRRPAAVPCGFCAASGACAACAAFETGGRCRHCLGSGRLGGSPCFNCGGDGRCAACAGSAACDACGGSRQVALPWSPRPPAPKPAPAPAALAASPSPPVAAPGETVSWTGTGEWTLFSIAEGRPVEVDRVSGVPARALVRRPGFYRAVGPAGAAVFDVLDVHLPPGLAPGAPLPPLRIEPAVRSHAARWETVPGQDPVVLVEIPGLPARRLTVPSVPRIESIRAVPVQVPVRAGQPAVFRADASPPLGPDAGCQWTLTGGGRTETSGSRGPVFEHLFAAPGVYTLRVEAGGIISPPVEVPVYRVEIVDAQGRPVPEARMLSPRPEAFRDGRLREEVLAAAPERLRVLVEDPAGGAPGSVRIWTRSPEGGRVQGPVELALGGAAGRRTTRAFGVLSDLDDAGREPLPEDGTLHAVVRGRIEVEYRGLAAGSVPVGPMILHEIPLRVVAAGGGAGLDRELAVRVAQANAIWEPLGRRFRLASVIRRDAPGHLLLLRGRAAGVDAAGRPSRAGARIEGKDWSVPTPWLGAGGARPAALVARDLQARLDLLHPGARAELFEGLFGGDPDAVLLRVLRADGEPLRLQPLGGDGDASQSCLPLVADLSDGCEVSPTAGRLSLEEAAVILGLRDAGPGGLDLVVVPELRSLSARPAFKVYPPGRGLPAALEGSAILSARLLDDAGRHPYVLARALGELLLPPGLSPGPEDTLFQDPPSEQAGVDGRKRVSTATARKILELGRSNPGSN